MKKSVFFVFVAFLFIISCSNGDDPLLPCITVSDCPDSSYSCLDGYCIHNGAVIDPSDSESDTSSGDTLPDAGNDSGDTSDNGEGSDDTADSELPDSVTVDDDETSDEDADQKADDDGETDSDTNTDDDQDTGDTDLLPECSKNSDCLSYPNNIRCDTSTGKCVMCLSDDDCLSAYGQSCDLTIHQCVSDKTCAAAIEKLPHGGKFDWEDGTTQGFTTNNYWNVVDSSLISARSGSYSFGNYSGYSSNMDYTSVLQPADLSICSSCKVNVGFYAKGQVPFSENGYDFIHPTCNGEGTVTARNSTGGSQSLSPQSPWEMADGYYQKVNSYSTSSWTTLTWELPSSCKTAQFVFGLRFSSNASIEKNGLVVDDLTIAPAATEHEPDGAFESADGGDVKGWACDLDAPLKNILVKIEYYKNKDVSSVAVTRWAYAKLQRPGDAELQARCSETYNHGFEMPFDEGLKEILGEGEHSAAVFAVDIPATESKCAGTYTKLGGTKEFVIVGNEQ